MNGIRGGARAADEIEFGILAASPGFVLVARSDKGVCAVLPGDEEKELERDLQRRFPGSVLKRGDGEFGELVSAVAAFVEAPTRAPDVALDIRGSEFQKQVWQALREIPAGATVTYGAIAKRIGKPEAVRAVAQACGANPLAVLVPCHRVVRSDGGLSGYRWGIERKKALLDWERTAVDRTDASPPGIKIGLK